MSDNLFENNNITNDEPQPETEVESLTVESTPGGSAAGSYTDDSIQTLSWNQHIRRRPGMYIGKLGDGTHSEDGIYILVKEVVDNSIDEFNMGMGSRIDITLSAEGEVTVRDYGRGIPLGKVKNVASEIDTGGKFDDKNFKKSVGLNGVGLKAVNALSDYCTVSSVREGKKSPSNSRKARSYPNPSRPTPASRTAPTSGSNRTTHCSRTSGSTRRPSRRWSRTTHTSTPASRYTSMASGICRVTVCSTC